MRRAAEAIRYASRSKRERSRLQRVEAGEDLQRFEAALHQLPPGQHEALLLSQRAGLSHAEITQVTGGAHPRRSGSRSIGR